MKDYLQILLDDGESKTFLSQAPEGLIEEWGQGILKVNSSHDLSPLIISCGVHGNETAPIEILNDILNDLVHEKVEAKRSLLLIFGHIKAMREHKRFIDFNMNRLFSGMWKQHEDAQESERAQELERAVDKFLGQKKTQRGWHLDLHTAIRPSHFQRFAVFPKQDNTVPLQEELNLLGGLGIDAVLLANGKASTFSAHSNSHYNCLSYTLELGKVFPFGKNPHEKFQMAKEGLLSLINSDHIIEVESQMPLLFQVEKELIKDHTDYHLNLSEDYANFTPLEEGHILEKLKDGQELRVGREMAVVFPNNDVPIGQRTGLLVKKLNK